jgi:hypothetical protein
MSGTLLILPRLVLVDSSGRPLAGATLTFYAAGTSTLASVYTTAALTTAHPNPITSNAAGQFPAIYLDPANTYRIVAQTAGGVQLWAEDNVPAVGTGSSGGGGTPGTPGLSVAEVVCYLRSDTTPATPTGGSFNFDLQVLTPPSGWSSGVPSGTAPVWESRAVAAIEGAAGIDVVLTWSAPVKVLSDGSAVDIIFRRSASQPSTPAPSSGTPSGWYSDVASVPSSSDTLWSSVGTRAHAGQPWVWQLPIKVEGDIGPEGPQGPEGPTGPSGTSPTLYYIAPTGGTALKNGSGSLTVQARKIVNGVDSLISTGSIKLYVGSTVVTEANGYATGSDGYTGVFDEGDINGATTVTLKDGPTGDPLDTITLVDIDDGTSGGVGEDAVYGYVEASGPLAWTRGVDQSTWTPSATTVQLDCTFVQSGSPVARVAHVITRDADGLLTGAPGTHSGGDLNGSRVTPDEFGEGSRSLTVRFTYSYNGDVSVVSEGVLTALSGANGADGEDGAPGDPGDPGEAALVLKLTRRSVGLVAYSNGNVQSYADAKGYVTVWSGTSDVTASAVLEATATGCTGTVNTSNDTPVLSQVKGYYQVTAMADDTASLLISATYGGETVTENFSLSKSYVGYEIVASTLPTADLFAGRIVFRESDGKLYRYTSGAWTTAVPTVDLTGVVEGTQIAAGAITTAKLSAGAVTATTIATNAVTADKVLAGAITAAKISVTSLSSLSANIGTVTAGVVQSSTGGAKFDLSNARIVLNTAPGATGGYVRVMGFGFGPGNRYLDWYGPKPSGEFADAGIIANLTDANALHFLTIDGTQFNRRTRGEFEPKCWVNVNADTNPPTIGDRYNVSSVDRIGSGLTRITFASALPNNNYACATGSFDTSKDVVCMVYEQTTNYVTIRTVSRGAGSAIYPTRLNVIIFGSNVVGGSNVETPAGGSGGGAVGIGYLP